MLSYIVILIDLDREGSMTETGKNGSVATRERTQGLEMHVDY